MPFVGPVLLPPGRGRSVENPRGTALRAGWFRIWAMPFVGLVLLPPRRGRSVENPRGKAIVGLVVWDLGYAVCRPGVAAPGTGAVR
jgi:hypothetical protein